MEVIFRAQSHNSSRIGPMKVNGRKFTIDNGKETVTDKELIKGLMSHSFYQRGHFYMDSDPKLVNDYLANNEEPDYIDEDYLQKVSNDAILRLGEICGCRNEFPELIKNELRNEPITDAIAEVVKEDLAKSAEEESEEDESEEEGSKSKKKKKKKKKKKS